MKNSYKIAVVIITNNRIKDAVFNLFLIKNVWAKNLSIQKTDIYHAYNGSLKLYQKKTEEDFLIFRENRGHFFGAADLIDSGIKHIFDSNFNYDYIFVLSSDVFILNSNYLVSVLDKMRVEKKVFAGSLWLSSFFIPKLFASEFFIIEKNFARKIFPLNLEKYFQNRSLILFMRKIFKFIPIMDVPLVELAITEKILNSLKLNFFNFLWRKEILLLPHRETVFFVNRYHSSKIDYFSHHDFDKKKILVINRLRKLGIKIDSLGY